MLSGAAIFLWPLSAMTHVLSRSKRRLLKINMTSTVHTIYCTGDSGERAERVAIMINYLIFIYDLILTSED